MLRILLTVLTGGALATAQETPKPAESQPENPFFLKTTVVVTATRSEAVLENSPVSTGVITRGDLEIQNTRLLDRALALSEGLYSLRTKGPQDTLTGVGMRGFDGRGGNQSRVLILLDGQPVNDGYTGGVSWSTLPVGEVDRIEVARGPFSSLYGGNAMGGVVNILTRPVESRLFEGSIQYGTYDTVDYSLRYSDRLLKKVGVTFGYQRMQQGGYATNGVFATATAVASAAGPVLPAPQRFLSTTGAARYQIGDQGDNWFNQHAMRAKADYTFSPNTTFSAQYILRRYGYGYDGYRAYLRDSAGQLVDRGNYFFDDGGLRRITPTPGGFLSGPGGGYSHFAGLQLFHSFSARNTLRVSGGIQAIPVDWFSTPGGTATGLGGPGQTADRPNRSWHGDAQWNWAKSPRHDIVVGTETRRDGTRISEYDLSQYADRFSRIRTATFAKGQAFTQAFFAQDRIAVTPKLQMVAGGRFDYWKTSDGFSVPFFGATEIAYPQRTSNAFSGKLAAIYQVLPSFSLRASVGSSFRNPTVYELFRTWRSSTGTSFLANPNLLPERLNSWEFGLRHKMGKKADLDIAYYENRVTNLIYRTTDLVANPNGSIRVFQNAGRGRTRGLELGMKQRLTNWLMLKETYTLSDARIVENRFLTATEGRRVPYVPRNISSFAVLAAKRGWSGSVTGQYMGKIYSTDLNNDVVKGVPGAYDAFFLLDASVSYRFERYATLYASVNNAIDRTYWEFYQAPGRTVSIGLRLRSR